MKRVAAIDGVRGIAMILMTLDHASSAFNAGRISGDGAAMFRPGSALPALQFTARWVTHFCAPAFLFLAGIALALTVDRRLSRGERAWTIDRDLAIRGVLLIALEVMWMTWAWRFDLSPIHLEVLFAIGASMLAMIAIRRWPSAAIACACAALFIGAEALARRLDPSYSLAAATVTGGTFPSVVFLYPVLPWLAFMMLGWLAGQWVAASRATARHWFAAAVAAFAVFVLVRGANGYGNFGLLREDGSLVQWLHVSKYPPSLSFAALELGLVCALLGALWNLDPDRRTAAPLLVLGRTALVFYLLHIHLLKGVAFALGVHRACGLVVVMAAWLAALVALYPVCRAYDRIKHRRPESVLRFL